MAKQVSQSLNRTSKAVPEQERTTGDSAVSVTTVEEAIAYFLGHGINGAHKFMYLKHRRPASDIAATAGHYNPYDLVVVSPSEIDLQDEHFVMSVRGITHLQPSIRYGAGRRRAVPIIGQLSSGQSRRRSLTTKSVSSLPATVSGPNSSRMSTGSTTGPTTSSILNASRYRMHSSSMGIASSSSEPPVLLASEFTTLAEWARYASCFTVCASLRVFRDYIPSKAFRTWAANVRHLKYRKQRSAVRTHLFTWRPPFVAATTALVNAIGRIGDTLLADVTGAWQGNTTSATLSSSIDTTAANNHAHNNNNGITNCASTEGASSTGIGRVTVGAGGADSVDTRQSLSRSTPSLGPTSAASGTGATVSAASITTAASVAAAQSNGSLTRFSLPGFIEAQAQARNDGSKAIDRELLALQEQLERCCTAITTRAHPPATSDDWTYNLSSSGGNTVSSPGATTTDMTLRHAAHGNGKKKSMALEKAEAAARAAALAEALDEESKLGALIRVADARIVEAIAAQALQQVESILSEFLTPSPARQALGLFYTSVYFTDSGELEFSPSCSELQSAVDYCITELLKTLGNVPRLLFAPSFRQYTASLSTASGQTGVFGAPSIEGLLNASTTFAEARNQLALRIASDYAAATTDAIRSLSALRPIHEFAKGRASEETQAPPQGPTLSSLQADLTRLRVWDTALDRMRLQHIVGALCVDLRPIRSGLQPIVVGGLRTATAALLQLGRTACKAACVELTAATASLTVPNTASNESTASNETSAATPTVSASTAAHLASVASSVDEIYRTLAYHDIRVPSEDSVMLDDLHTAAATIATAAAAAITAADPETASATET